MIRLRVLGSIDLRSADGRELRTVLAQPKRFALLAYLAAHPGRFCQRDSLLALFWPELDDTHARWALSQALRFLRKELGRSSSPVLIGRHANELGIDSAALWSDVAEFRDHLAEGRYGEALELYRGELLSGFFAGTSPAFEDWLSRERTRLQGEATRAARALSELREREQSLTEAVAAARRAVDLAAVDERVLRELLELLDRSGDRAGALAAFDDFSRRLAAEYDSAPAAETVALISRIRAGVPASVPASVSADVQTRTDARASTPSSDGNIGQTQGLQPDRNAAQVDISAPTHDRAVPTAIDGWAIERELGRGGMATVFLARDPKHDRRVALKVLRAILATPTGTATFLREVQVSARLAHPHILPLIDSGTHDGLPYLVTPYVAGESLRARMERSPLSAAHAFGIALEILEALDYAHRSGIVHCDIKPENILLADGHAVVADFGIARALRVAESDSDAISRAAPTTFGSLDYLSPDVAAGLDADARTDLYAFGRLFHEMLTGALPATVESDQTLTEQLSAHQPAVRQLLRECLEVDPAARPASAANVRARLLAASAAELAVPRARTGTTMWMRLASAAQDLRRAVSVRQFRTRWMLAGAFALGVLVTGTVIGFGDDAPADRDSVRFVFNVDSGLAFVDAPGTLALSPNGRQVAFVATQGDGVRHLFIRSSGELRSRMIPGAEGAEQLFFSPDGEWVGFYVKPQLKKVRISHGDPILIGDVPAMFGAYWTSDDAIVLSTAGRLAETTASGGNLRMIATPDTAAGELQQLWPIVLADGKTIVYTARGRYVEESRLAVAARRSDARRILDLAGTGPLGVVDGQLIYGVGTGSGGPHDLFAVPFDQRDARVTGVPRTVVSGVRVNSWGRAAASVSQSGSLVYQFTEELRRQIVVTQRDGSRRTLPGGARSFHDPRFSPDGKRLAVSVDGDGLYVFDLASATFNRVTSGTTWRARYPEWTPDGKRLIYLRCTTERTPCEVWTVPAEVGAVESFYTKSDQDQVEMAETVFSPDGRTLVTRVNARASGQRSIWYRRQDADAALKPLVTMPGNQFGPRVSPDGKWVAFYTNTSPGQVYVSRLGGVAETHKVSIDAGENPVWSPDGKQLYYVDRSGGSRVVAATLQLAPVFAVVARDTIFDGGFDSRPDVHGLFDVAPDGRRFAFLERVDREPQIIVVHDWVSEMRQSPRLAGRRAE